MNIEDRVSLFSEQIMCGADIYTWRYDAEARLMRSNCPKESYLDETLNAFGGKDALRAYASEPEGKPLVLSISTGLVWCVTSGKRLAEERNLYVIGPVWSTDASLSGSRFLSMDTVGRERGVSMEWLREMDAATRSLPVVMPRLKLSADHDRMIWYGLGPEDTYTDRKQGGKLGVYEKTASENMARYLVPQESGNKCGVRYAKVVDRKGRGMEFFGDGLSVNVLPYTPRELENAAHSYELPEVHYTVVRVAMQQMGVAGDDSWGAKTHPEFLLPAEEDLKFTFCFRGI